MRRFDEWSEQRTYCFSFPSLLAWGTSHGKTDAMELTRYWCGKGVSTDEHEGIFEV